MQLKTMRQAVNLTASRTLKFHDKSLSVLVPLLALVLLVTACSSASKTATPKATNGKPQYNITIGYFTGGMQAIRATLMEEAGIFKKYGISVTDVAVSSGPALVAGVIGGSIDVGVGYPALDFPPMIEKRGVEMLSPYTEPGFYGVAGQTNLGLKNAGVGITKNALSNIRLMAGKTVGVSAIGGETQIYVEQLATQAGIPATSPDYIGVGSTATNIAAFQAHRTDFTTLNPGEATVLASEHIPYVMAVDGNPPGHPYKGELEAFWSIGSSYASSHPGAAKAFCKANEDSYKFAANPKNRAVVEHAIEVGANFNSAQAAYLYDHYNYILADPVVVNQKVWNAQKIWLQDTPYSNDALPYNGNVYAPCF